MTNNDLLFFIDVFNEELYFKDKTEYPVEINGQSMGRDDFALALVYSYDDYEHSYVDLSNSITRIAASDADIGKYRAYLIPLFGGSYNEHQVVFHEEKFYVSLTSGNSTTPSAFNNKWEVLTTGNAPDILEANFTGGYPIAYVDMICDIPELEMFYLKKLPNRSYELINSFSLLNAIVRIDLYDYENRLIGPVASTFTLPADGVYGLRIKYIIRQEENPDAPDNPNPASSGSEEDEVILRAEIYYLTAFIPIIHMDESECCYKNMVESLYCTDENYCVANKCFEQREVQNKINELGNMYFVLMQNMHVNRMKFYRVYNDDAEARDYIQQVGQLVNTMNIVSSNCNTKCCEDV